MTEKLLKGSGRLVKSPRLVASAVADEDGTPIWTFDSEGRRLDENGAPMCECWMWNEAHASGPFQACPRCADRPPIAVSKQVHLDELLRLVLDPPPEVTERLKRKAFQEPEVMDRRPVKLEELWTAVQKIVDIGLDPFDYSIQVPAGFEEAINELEDLVRRQQAADEELQLDHLAELLKKARP